MKAELGQSQWGRVGKGWSGSDSADIIKEIGWL